MWDDIDWSLGLGDDSDLIDWSGDTGSPMMGDSSWSAVPPWNPSQTPDMPYAGYNSEYESGWPQGSEWSQDAGAPQGGSSSDFMGGIEKWVKQHPFMSKVGMGGGLALMQLMGNMSAAKRNKASSDQLRADQQQRQQQYDHPALDPRFDAPGLTPRTSLGTNPLAAYVSGNSAEQLWTRPQQRARGGRAPGGGLSVVRDSRMIGDHGGGQQDNVPAMLSAKEYVFDADTVAALGDGNPDEGARRLDEMREAIRGHKRSAPVKKIPPKAKSPLEYLRKAA